jgi:hypothetical protein
MALLRRGGHSFCLRWGASGSGEEAGLGTQYPWAVIHNSPSTVIHEQVASRVSYSWSRDKM